MAFIDSRSHECCLSGLDIFSMPPTQVSVDAGNYVEFQPISSIVDSSTIEFNVLGAGSEYLDLSNTLLSIKASITKEDGTPIEAASHVGPTNLFLHSLFSELDILLNDVQITSSNHCYAYRAFLETLLSYSEGSKQSQLQASLFYKDEGNFEATNPALDPVANIGFKKRSAFTLPGPVQLIGKLHSDIFFQSRYLLNEVTMRIRLIRSKDAFSLMYDGAVYKTKIIEAKLLVRKVRLAPSVYLAHQKALQTGEAKYPIKRIITKSFTIPTGQLDLTNENLFTGQIPNRIVLGLVENRAFNGAGNRNPYNFKNFDLKQISLYVDTLQNSLKPMELNFENGQFIEGFLSLFAGTNKLFTDESNNIARSEYPNGYSLFCFDLSPDLQQDDHYSLLKSGTTRVSMKFGTALPTTVSAICYAEFDSVISIDKNRKVLCDYKS